MIGPGVAFSAAHVLTDIPPDPTVHPPAEDLLAHIETSVVRGGRDQRPEGDFTGAYGVIAVNFLRSGDCSGRSGELEVQRAAFGCRAERGDHGVVAFSGGGDVAA